MDQDDEEDVSATNNKSSSPKKIKLLNIDNENSVENDMDDDEDEDLEEVTNNNNINHNTKNKLLNIDNDNDMDNDNNMDENDDMQRAIFQSLQSQTNNHNGSNNHNYYHEDLPCSHPLMPSSQKQNYTQFWTPLLIGNQIDDSQLINQFSLTPANIFQLNPGDKVDHRDCKGRWLCATIKKKNEKRLTISYENYHEKFDKTINYRDIANIVGRFAKATSFSALDNTAYPQLREIGAQVKIWNYSDNQWEVCQIIELDQDRKNGRSGQIKVSNGINYRYWYHPYIRQEIQIIQELPPKI